MYMYITGCANNIKFLKNAIFCHLEGRGVYFIRTCELKLIKKYRSKTENVYTFIKISQRNRFIRCCDIKHETYCSEKIASKILQQVLLACALCNKSGYTFRMCLIYFYCLLQAISEMSDILKVQ